MEPNHHIRTYAVYMAPTWKSFRGGFSEKWWWVLRTKELASHVGKSQRADQLGARADSGARLHHCLLLFLRTANTPCESATVAARFADVIVLLDSPGMQVVFSTKGADHIEYSCRCFLLPLFLLLLLFVVVTGRQGKNTMVSQ